MYLITGTRSKNTVYCVNETLTLPKYLIIMNCAPRFLWCKEVVMKIAQQIKRFMHQNSSVFIGKPVNHLGETPQVYS